MTASKLPLLVIGASGMLGASLFRFFQNTNEFDVYGTAKEHVEGLRTRFYSSNSNSVMHLDVTKQEELESVFKLVKPKVVINCAGIIKQRADHCEAVESLKINSLFPRQLYLECVKYGARLVHFSTDCVFSGSRGMYEENDFPDAQDLYGLSKALGEVAGRNCITIRTSIIGHELFTSHSLINWFLSQENQIIGYQNAIFTGFPTIEIANILKEFVIPNSNLEGLFHISSEPISKFDLLSLVANEYGKNITINPSASPTINRSLNSNSFRLKTGFTPKLWPEMIKCMYRNYKKYGN